MRLAYLTVANTLAVLGLLLAGDRDKDTEILVLRHQVGVLERHLGGKKVRFTPADRALLAALSHRLKPQALDRMRLLVRPGTVLHWHRDLIRKRHAARSRPRRPGRPRTVRSVRALVLRLVREVMDLQDAGCRARFLIRDRDGKLPKSFDAILADAGIEVVLSGVRMPCMNSIMERWVQTCRRELLDRTLIWDQHHLLRALRQFEAFYNHHRPHQGTANARPLHPLPPPITDPGQIPHLDIRRRQRLGRILNEYDHAA